MYTYYAKAEYAAIYYLGEVVLFATREGTAMTDVDWEALCERLRGVAHDLNAALSVEAGAEAETAEACQEALALAT